MLRFTKSDFAFSSGIDLLGKFIGSSGFVIRSINLLQTSNEGSTREPSLKLENI